jgi:hypothetical protein
MIGGFKSARTDAVDPTVRPRRFLFALSALLSVAALFLAPVARARVPHGRFGVGDSIMLSAADDLAPYDIKVNAEVGRQFSEGVAVVRRLATHDRLPRQVIVHLGTNGYVSSADCDDLFEYAGPKRRVFLVTVHVPREWEEAVNDELHRCATRHENGFLIRWYGKSQNHPEWFDDSDYHLTTEGQAAYAAFLDSSVDATLAALRAVRRGKG